MSTFFEDIAAQVAEDAEVILAETLNDALANELAWKIARFMPGGFLSDLGLRYLLIDGETRQPESPRLFGRYQEALDEIEERNLTRCWVALVILEPQTGPSAPDVLQPSYLPHDERQ